MTEKKRDLIEIIIQGKGTNAELKKKIRAIRTGKEPLPDGSLYPPRKDEVHVKIFWDTIEKAREAFLDFYASPKQLLDIKLRPVREKDLALPSPIHIDRKEMFAAIQGGFTNIDLNFLESSLVHAIVEAFSKTDYPEKIELTRSGLYELMRVEKSVSSTGRIQWQEGGAFWRIRNKYHNALLKLGSKSHPFIFLLKQGVDKKGKPLSTFILTYEPLIKVRAVYKDVRQPEIPGIIRQDKSGEKRFSHYEIRLNPAARGEVEHYYRYLPSGLSREISNYRRERGERPSSAEINLIEFLYQMADERRRNPERIEINYLLLAEKIGIKAAKDPTHPQRTRKPLRRYYQMATDLKFALKIFEDQPGTKGKTKDIIFLNPARFKYLGQKELFKDTET